MESEVNKLLRDILNSIEAIDSHLQGKRDFTMYKSKRIIRSAVEREIEIIGEATRNLLKINPDIPITSKRQIVDLRNIVVHAYDSLNDQAMWVIVVKHLPLLKSEVESLLKQE
jgi:uncharacterized protein with HEPN domain